MERQADPTQFESRLQTLAEIAHEAGATHLAGEARNLAQRVAEKRFHVACVGQLKRGKSSLINALVGDLSRVEGWLRAH